ncbi:hypothetical protein JAAARDRAFT_30658 [Jaapia argillacea MUCL 33604]|uniref:Uncharacterized protein n=1 Tax=Jaapia argillacea MUCL 33604 TaxID=933084 RepID=A0A067Q6R9_9AGAM|nr:hypothetical protein JAAARDRAFT_30658 [Jaapia argillacea MUCL 33604]
MASISLFFLLLCVPNLSVASSYDPRGHPPSPHRHLLPRGVPPQGFYLPTSNGGAMLTIVPDTYPAGLGEPLNGIITANSDSDVLVDQEINGGLRNYFQAVGFSSECLGQHSGSDQGANLGDGNGVKNETAVIRWDYGDPAFGTCTETIQGGNHFRYWVQNGNQANSGAIFMGLSYELPIALQHDIIPNGYNLARDWFVGNATGGQFVNTSTVSNTSTFSGSVSSQGYTYQTDVQYVSGLLQNTSNGINHYLSVGVDGKNAIDGLVALIQVKITAKPATTTKSSANHSSLPPRLFRHLPPVLALAALLTFPLLCLL